MGPLPPLCHQGVREVVFSGLRRRMAVLPLLGVMVLSGSSHSWAGTEENPEISANCEAANPYPTTEAMVICSGWFDGNWRLEPREDDPDKKTWVLDSLQSTMKLFGGMEDRHSFASYTLGWSIDGCRHFWRYYRHVDQQQWVADFFEDCPDIPLVRIVIPEQNLTIGADRVSIRLGRADELGSLHARYDVGAELSAPVAQTFVRLSLADPPLAHTYSWDRAGPGSSFLIGQDRPPDPQV